MVTIRFFAAGGPASGVELKETYQHIGFFAQSGQAGNPVAIGEPQGGTWITDINGVAPDSNNPASGKLVNNEWVDSSGVSIDDGARVNLSSVTASGNATIQIKITDTGNFNAYNARLYAYDGTDINNDPSGIWVLSYEIIAPEHAGTGDSQWALIDATNYNYLVDKTTSVGYAASGEFNYFIGLSIRPKITATSGAKTFGLYFTFDTI